MAGQEAPQTRNTSQGTNVWKLYKPKRRTDQFFVPIYMNNMSTSSVSSEAGAKVSKSSEELSEVTLKEAATATTSRPSQPRMKIPKHLTMIWLAMILLLIIIKPAARQLTLSPNLTVYDTSGLYSGESHMVKTIAPLHQHTTMH